VECWEHANCRNCKEFRHDPCSLRQESTASSCKVSRRCRCRADPDDARILAAHPTPDHAVGARGEAPPTVEACRRSSGCRSGARRPRQRLPGWSAVTDRKFTARNARTFSQASVAAGSFIRTNGRGRAYRAATHGRQRRDTRLGRRSDRAGRPRHAAAPSSRGRLLQDLNRPPRLSRSWYVVQGKWVLPRLRKFRSH
jgi:hypothetical protein